MAHDSETTLDHLEKFSQSLTARVFIGYIVLLLMGFLWLCFIWTINAVFGLSIGKDAMYNVGRFVRRRRRNAAQNNNNNNNNNNANQNANAEQNNQQVVEQPPQIDQNNQVDVNNNNEQQDPGQVQQEPAVNNGTFS